MAREIIDQAEGLRRLLAPNSTRIITLASGQFGVGRTGAAINLAAALSQAGKDVLVIDENPEPRNAATGLGLAPRYDLLHTLRGEKRLEEVLVNGPGRILLLPAARGIKALAKAHASEEKRLLARVGEFSHPIDFVIVDTALSEADSLLPLNLQQQAVIMVSPAKTTITQAYMLIKRMYTHYGNRHFQILVNKARSQQEAETIFRNLEDVTRRFLGATLGYLAWIPLDPELARATSMRCPVLKANPAAESSSRFFAIAEKLATSAIREPEARSGSGSPLHVFMHRLTNGHAQAGRRSSLGQANV